MNYPHQFHIPVMGLGFTIDTPLKVARFGISSVVSIIEDELIEEMRCYHCMNHDMAYEPIKKASEDSRARRITAYLNLLNKLVKDQMVRIKNEAFESGSDIVKYFDLLPENSDLKKEFLQMLNLEPGREKHARQLQLKEKMMAGDIDVNIMSKADRINYDKDGREAAREYSDALSALRGFALSDLNSSLVLSAGYNPVLYSYLENFGDFYPDTKGILRKKIILKVSDYRSAVTQGKILAKKGIWISEYRIESGLNCGGHAFATEGRLLGPILEEFRQNKETLRKELLTICNNKLSESEKALLPSEIKFRISAQGGIGTAEENEFLLRYYATDSTGWGSPFLLVPEATNVDDETLQRLVSAKKEDYYLSRSSPLGIPFHSFRGSASEEQRMERIRKGRPGSPCYKKYLSTNTEFTVRPICTASRQYQALKIKDLKKSIQDKEVFQEEYSKVIEKDCLCEGLGASARNKYNIRSPHKLNAVAICPGPNLAYFSGIFSLKEMVDHIYGRINLLKQVKRSNMFLNELHLYSEHFKNEIREFKGKCNRIQARYLENFKKNLLEGIAYYEELSKHFSVESQSYVSGFLTELSDLKRRITEQIVPENPEVISLNS